MSVNRQSLATLKERAAHYPDRLLGIDVVGLLADPHLDGAWAGDLIAGGEAVLALVEAAADACKTLGQDDPVRERLESALQRATTRIARPKKPGGGKAAIVEFFESQ